MIDCYRDQIVIYCRAVICCGLGTTRIDSTTNAKLDCQFYVQIK